MAGSERGLAKRNRQRTPPIGLRPAARFAPFAASSSLRAGSAGRNRSGTVGLPLPFPRRQVLCRNHEDWLCFAAQRQPFSVRNSILCNDFHPWNFGFVWSLFHLQVSAGQTSRVPNLRVVPGRAAVAACAASELPESRLTLSVYATRHGLCAPDPSFWQTRWPDAARHNCNGFAGNAGYVALLHGGGAKMSAGSLPVRRAAAWASGRNADRGVDPTRHWVRTGNTFPFFSPAQRKGSTAKHLILGPV